MKLKYKLESQSLWHCSGPPAEFLNNSNNLEVYYKEVQYVPMKGQYDRPLRALKRLKILIRSSAIVVLLNENH